MHRGLYAILDLDSLGRASLDPLDFARRVLDAGSLAALQLRAKSTGAGAMTALAAALRDLCAGAAVPFFVNDRADVAVLAGADGVHLGQDDVPFNGVRRAFPSLRIGLSSHDAGQFAAAADTGASYVAIGPVYATATKADAAAVVGTDLVRAITQEFPDVAVVGIGGIDASNAARVRDAGARAGAVIAGLVVEPARITANARALHLALGGT